LISEIAAKGVEFHVGLDLLFDANGQGRRPLNNYFSTVLTPTDLPVEHSLCCYKGISEASITADSFKLDRSSGRITAPFTVSVPIPPNVPPGTYALWLRLRSPSNVAEGPQGDARAVRTQALTNNNIALPPFPIGNPKPPHLIWTLLTDVPSADGSRGTIAAEDTGNFDIASRVATQTHNYVIPRLSKDTGEPITYRLEPYLPMIAQGDQDIPNIPPISFKLPSGSLEVRVKRPDGTVNQSQNSSLSYGAEVGISFK
jgi:hypothetical protein